MKVLTQHDIKKVRVFCDHDVKRCGVCAETIRVEKLREILQDLIKASKEFGGTWTFEDLVKERFGVLFKDDKEVQR